MATTVSSVDAVIRDASQPNDPRQRCPLVLGGLDYRGVTDTVTNLNLRATPTAWYVAFSISLALLSLLLVCLVYLLATGVGVWGNNNTVSWGFPIINFVFWVGIGHVGLGCGGVGCRVRGLGVLVCVGVG
ncbi:MAG: hypothetical protein D6753_04415, partial [Planctomycetota bacterium]